jgi:hypothetical protein
MQQNTDIHPPTGATKLFDWADDNGQPVRSFVGPAWTVGDIGISVEGMQTARGVERSVYVNEIEFSTAEARDLIAAIIAAVDHIEQVRER